MQRFLKTVTGLFLIILIFMGVSRQVLAAKNPSSSSSTAALQQKTNFVVQAVIPKEQDNKNLGYFDVNVTPNSEHTFAVRIFNTGVKKVTVTVQANNAYTSDSGVIAYDRYQQPLLNPKTKALSDLIEGTRQQKVTLNPGELKTVEFKVKLPSQDYKGMILGAIVSSAFVGPTKSKQVTINNRISYNLGVVLRSNDKSVTPNLKVGMAEPTIRQAQKGVAVPLTNTAAMNASKMSIDSKIYKNGKLYKSINRANLQMAPYSKFSYFMPVKLSAGNYRWVGQATPANGGAVNFTRRFSVTKAQARKSALPKIRQPQSNTGWIVLMVILAVVVIAVVWIGIYFFAMQSGVKKREAWQNRRQGQTKKLSRSEKNHTEKNQPKHKH